MMYRLIKNTIMVAGLLWLCYSCGKDETGTPSEEETPQEAAVKLVVDKDYVLNPSGGKVSATVTTEDGKTFNKLLILKRGMVVSELDRIENAARYEFSYSLSADEDLVGFSFVALGRNDEVQDTENLTVERSRGLKPFNLERVSRVTGRPLSGESFPSPNNTDARFDVGCTDLGIVWEMGNGDFGIFFGDTDGKNFVPTAGGGGNGGHWRSNVLAYSNDRNLSDGLYIYGMATKPDNATVAREIIPSAHITDGTGSFTTIPTAAIHANGAEYVHYMDVRMWGTAGKWDTNFSELYMSTDNGRNWQRRREVVFSAKSNFALAAYAKKDGYIYMMGTPSGRFGSAHLGRFLEKDILSPSNYEYLVDGVHWVKGVERNATPVFEGPVGELSLAYNSHFKKWIVTYLNEDRAAIVMRYANDASGPWSSEYTLVQGWDYPALYNAYIHPLSNSTDEMYFLMSLWHPYNVFLMRADLRLE